MIFDRQLFWEQIFPLVRLRGKGTRAFLHGQTSADILAENKNFLVHSCWLDTAGRVRALLEIRLIDEGADLLVDGRAISLQGYSSDISFIGSPNEKKVREKAKEPLVLQETELMKDFPGDNISRVVETEVVEETA